MQYNRNGKNVKQETYAAIFFVSFILAAITVEGCLPLSLGAVITMGVCIIKGRLWCMETEGEGGEDYR